MEKYLKDALSFLSDIDRESLNQNIVYQLNKLDAQKYNQTQTEIYRQLNQLYEKTRILEDVNAYLVTATQNKISTSSRLCEDLLKEIEKNRDSIKETTYRTIFVDMTPTSISYDRDGLELPSAILYNKEVVSKFNERRALPYKTEVKTYKKVYKNNVGSLEKGEPYRSYYITDQPYDNGIIEEFSFIFMQPFGVNRIAIKPSATEVSNYQLHNQKDTINLTELQFENAIEAEKASVVLNTLNYKEKVFLCDASRLAPNALETLHNEIYKEAIKEKTLSQSELDDLLGITRLKADYEKYLQDVESWKKRRQEVVEINRKNGYDDSVPSFELTQLPSDLGANNQDMKGRLENPTIDTKDLLPTKEITEKDSSKQRIVYMYDRVDTIYPSAERYRYDYLDPSHDRYFEKLKDDSTYERV